MIDIQLYKLKNVAGYSEEQIKNAIFRLIERYMNSSVISYRHIGEGTFGMVYKIETDKQVLVLKFYRLPNVHTTQALEMRTLKKLSTVKIPEVYFVHDKDEEIPMDAMGMEFVEGIPCVELDSKNFSRAQKLQLADELTTALYSISQAKNVKYGLLEDAHYDTWLDFYRPLAEHLHDWVVENGTNPKHKMPKELLEVMDYSWNNFDRIFNEPFSEPSLIHNDLCVCNFMVNPETLKLTAIIDPNRAMYADVEYELHNLTNITGDEFYLYQTYKEKYPVSSNCDVKIAFYALYNEILYYLITEMSYEYIYPRMIERLWREMKKHFTRQENSSIDK